MPLLFSMPGASEWIFIILILLVFLITPILAIVYYLRSKDLDKQLQVVTKERNELLEKLLENI